MPEYLRTAHLSARQLSPLLVGCTIEEVEREVILRTLEATAGNRTWAADMLGISVRTLRNRIRNYSSIGMHVPPPFEGRPAGSYSGGHDGNFPSWLRLVRFS